jgi:hypothetical protein
MGRGAFILTVVALAAPAVTFAADAPAPLADDAPPTAEPAPVVEAPSAVEAPSVVVEPPVAETSPVRPPTPVTPVAPAATTAAPVAATATGPPGPRPKRETHGLALAAGLGIAYGFLGLQARYDVPVTRSVTVSPFVASGLAFGVLSGPVGVSTALGARHRFVVDLAVAPMDRMRFILHGTTVTDRSIFGPMLAAGYEHMSDGGWFQRTTIELGYATWTTAPVSVNSYPVIFGGLAFGRRIW